MSVLSVYATLYNTSNYNRYTFCLLIIIFIDQEEEFQILSVFNFKLRNFIIFISKRVHNFLLRNFHLEIPRKFIQISSHDPLMDIITAYRLSIRLSID